MRDRADVLETALRALAPSVELPPTPSISPWVGARLRSDVARAHRPPFAGVAIWSRRRLILAIALGLVLLGGAAVAARLAIGAVGIEVVPSLAPSASPEAPSAFGREVSLRQAAGAGGIEPGWPPAFGSPQDVYVVRGPLGSKAVVLAWRDIDGYETIPSTPWSAVLIEMRGRVDMATKYVLAGSVHRARVDGERAFWITGPHDLTMRGAFGGQTVRVNGNVLLWQRSGGVTYRLETMLSKSEAIEVAETLRT